DYEYLELRFNRTTRVLASCAFLIFQLGRIGVVLYLPSVALSVVTGVDIYFCILMMGGISLLYTIMGGIEAVIWTDVMQVMVLLGGGLLCLAMMASQFEGGLKTIIDLGAQDHKFELLNFALDFQQPTFWVVILGGFFSNLIVYSSDQTMVQRYLATSDTLGAQKSLWITVLISFCSAGLFFFIGTALYAFFKNSPEALLPGMAATDAVFPWYIITQLPDGLSGLLIAGIFAAAMSSLSSSMNSAATAYTVDFHQNFGWKGEGLKVGRWATLVFGLAGTLFAVVLASTEVKSIWDEFLKIVGLLTGGLGGVFLLGIISQRANGVGAMIGLLGSALIQYWMGMTQPIHLLLFTATGFVSCILIGYLASLCFPGANKPIPGLTIYDQS
ncbi:MAG: sodium:solute symporter, partial [Bacteroidota bacterium]